METRREIQYPFRVERRTNDHPDAFDIRRGLKRELSAIADIEVEAGRSHEVGQERDSLFLSVLGIDR